MHTCLKVKAAEMKRNRVPLLPDLCIPCQDDIFTYHDVMMAPALMGHKQGEKITWICASLIPEAGPSGGVSEGPVCEPWRLPQSLG